MNAAQHNGMRNSSAPEQVGADKGEPGTQPGRRGPGRSLWRAARQKAALAARKAAKKDPELQEVNPGAGTGGSGGVSGGAVQKTSGRTRGRRGKSGTAGSADSAPKGGNAPKHSEKGTAGNSNSPAGPRRRTAKSKSATKRIRSDQSTSETASSASQRDTKPRVKKSGARSTRGHAGRRPAAPIPTAAEFQARRAAVNRIMVARQQGARVQIGVLEDGKLVEHYVDHGAKHTGSLVGNVYLGRVTGVYPGMEVAFVDIGQERGGMLHVRQVNWNHIEASGEGQRIEHALTKGDRVLVQVTKDPVGGKGARLTMHVTLAGRHLVLDPARHGSSVSRKLPSAERARLRELLDSCLPENVGLIARTAAEGVDADDLKRDAELLAQQWTAIAEEARTGAAPRLLLAEPDMAVRVVRDMFNEGFSKLVVSGSELTGMLTAYVQSNAPKLIERVTPVPTDAFAEFGIDDEISAALQRKVALPSGGTLVIDRTEAMTVIDVNTGKHTGDGTSLEDTVTHTNMEAAAEIARQLRLRDIGGMIVVDFIDMRDAKNQAAVRDKLVESLATDTTPHEVAEVTSLGLVQLTRKRVGVSLLDAFTQTCVECSGSGRTQTGH